MESPGNPGGCNSAITATTDQVATHPCRDRSFRDRLGSAWPSRALACPERFYDLRMSLCSLPGGNPAFPVLGQEIDISSNGERAALPHRTPLEEAVIAQPQPHRTGILRSLLPVLLYERWEPSWEPFAVDFYGRLWTPADYDPFVSGRYGPQRTAMDDLRPSTDQKVGDSSSSGRAAEALARQELRRASPSLFGSGGSLRGSHSLLRPPGPVRLRDGR